MSKTNTLNEFRNKFRVEELLVLNSGSWSWSVRPSQVTVGSGIISLNRYALHLSEVTSSEMAEMAELVSNLEKSTKKLFNHNIMNYLMLMMVDHHVHYHVIPRYNGTRRFADLDWVDNGWPALPIMSDSQHKDQEPIVKIIQNSLISSLRS